MKKAKTTVAPLQTAVELSSIDLADQFVSLVKHTRGLGLKPMAAITTLELDGVYCGAVLVLYCAESGSDVNNKQHIPLMPYFYPQGVADALEGSRVIVAEHETKRSGVLTTWLTISETLP
jgi:hypothetical protein